MRLSLSIGIYIGIFSVAAQKGRYWVRHFDTIFDFLVVGVEILGFRPTPGLRGTRSAHFFSYFEW